MSIVSQIVQEINDALKTKDLKKAKAVADKIRGLNQKDLKDLKEQDIYGTTTVDKNGRRAAYGDPATFNSGNDKIVPNKVKDIGSPLHGITPDVNKPAQDVTLNDIWVTIGQGLFEAENNVGNFQTILQDVNTVLNINSDVAKAKQIAQEIGYLDKEGFNNLINSDIDGLWPTSGMGVGGDGKPARIYPNADDIIKVGQIPGITGTSREVGDKGLKKHDGQEGVREVIDILSDALTSHPGWTKKIMK